MAKRSGKIVRISPSRKLVIDPISLSQEVPTVIVDRRMDLSRLIGARQQCVPRVTWTSLFTKAYAVVSSREPALRRCYMNMPWPRFYEHHKTIATLNIGRRVNDEE